MECQQHLFSLPPERHYLNGAYMSPQLKSVEAAGIAGLLRKNNPANFSAQDFFDQPEILRTLFAQLVQAAGPEEIALIPSASYGMAIVARNLPARRGQNIVMAEQQFPSHVYPWMTLCQEKGLSLKTAPMPQSSEARGRIWNQLLLDSIDDNTCMVALPQVHWSTGTRFDLAALSAKAHTVGALLVVDGTQSVGALPMDVRALGIDALVCAGYKWLMSPYGTGYAWLGPSFIAGQPLEENWINRANSEDFSRLVDYQSTYQAGARRFDVGERSNFIQVPMCIAALQQILDWGPANIQEYCHTLLSDFPEKWKQHGFLLDEPSHRASHLFGVSLPNHIALAILQERLQAAGISISVRGAFLRVSPNVYNNATDMEALTEVLTSFN